MSRFVLIFKYEEIARFPLFPILLNQNQNGSRKILAGYLLYQCGTLSLRVILSSYISSSIIGILCGCEGDVQPCEKQFEQLLAGRLTLFFSVDK